jgi:small basic protein (TIGR04137 family)
MSMDKSLRRKNTLSRTRNVLTRSERVEVLKSEDKWKPESKPFGLPKVRVLKLGKKSKKAAKAAAGDEAADKKDAKKDAKK